MTDNPSTPTDAQPDEKIQQLEERVAELEAMTEIGDEDGDGWSMGDLLDLGLTRRQALTALALLGAGYALGPAITKALSEPAAASHGGASLGTAENPLQEIYVHDLYNTTDNIVADSIDTDNVTIGSGLTYETISTSFGDISGLSGDYAYVDLFVSNFGGRDGDNVHVRVNGNSNSEYHNVYPDGSSETLSYWRLATTTFAENLYAGVIRLTGGGGFSPVTLDAQGSTREANGTEVTEGNLTSDGELNSIEFLTSGSSIVSADDFVCVGAKF